MTRTDQADERPHSSDGLVSRRNALVGGAALLMGGALGTSARAAAATRGSRSGTRHHRSRLSAEQEAGQRVVWSYPA